MVKKQAIPKHIQSCIDSLRSYLELFSGESIEFNENVHYKREHCYELHVEPKKDNSCSFQIGISCKGGNGKGEFDILLDDYFHLEEIEFDESIVLKLCEAVSEGKVTKHQQYRDSKIISAHAVVHDVYEGGFYLKSNVADHFFSRIYYWFFKKNNTTVEKVVDYLPWL